MTVAPDSRFNLPPHYAGVPLGGLGTGCLELGEDARFRNITINNNRTAASRLPFADGTFLAIRAAAGSESVSRILQPQTNIAFESADISPPYSRPGDFSWYGLYPSSNFKLDEKAFPVEAQWSCLSPVIPYDTEASTLPVMLCALQFVNRTSEMYSVSALFNWENLRGCSVKSSPPDRGGIQPVSLDEVDEKIVRSRGAVRQDGSPTEPIGLAFGLDEPCTQNAHGNYCLATPGDSGARVTLQAWDKDDPDEIRSFWTSFNEYGSLTNRYSSRPTAHCGSVCAAFHLAPGETRRVQFVLSWYFPVYHVENADLGNAYTNEHPDSLSVATQGLKHTTYFQRAVNNWQQRLMKSSLPPWYARLLLDSCHVFSTNSVYTKSGEFTMMESPQEPALGSLARAYYASFGLLLFYPGLAGKELELIARTAGANRGVCRDLGRGTPRKPSMPLPEDSPDLVAKLILLVYRNFHLTGKTVALMQLFPKLRELMAGAVRIDRDSDWIPESRGGLGMFPVWKTPPLNSYGAGLWVAAAAAYTRLARHLRQTDDAEAWESRVRSALQTFEMSFWDERHHCYRFGVDEEPEFFHFAGQLAGPWSDQFMHIDAGFSSKRIGQAVETLMETNARPGGVALGDLADDSRPGATAAWPMISATCLACQQISVVGADTGLQTLKEMQKESISRAMRSYNQPLMWDLDRHDAAGQIQDRHIGALAVWHSLYALQGFWFSVPEQRLIIAPQLPGGVTRVDFPLFTPAAFGRLLFEVVPETGRQRLKIGFDSPVFIKVIEVALVEARMPTRVTLRINDEPAAMQHEVIRARPRNRIRITLQTPLQVQHPIDLWIE